MLLDGGRGHAVIQQRMEPQEVVRERFEAVIEHATGRHVIGFMSGNQQNPDMICEILILTCTDLVEAQRTPSRRAALTGCAAPTRLGASVERLARPARAARRARVACKRSIRWEPARAANPDDYARAAEASGRRWLVDTSATVSAANARHPKPRIGSQTLERRVLDGTRSNGAPDHRELA
jgi:hypothetical protein